MEHGQRRFVAVVILALSLVIVGYLIFFTPSETDIATPSSTIVDPTDAISTPSLSS